MNDAKIVLAHLSVINIGEQYYERSLQDFYFFFFFISYFMSGLMIAVVIL